MKNQYNSKDIAGATRSVSKTSETIFKGVEIAGVKLLNSKIKTVTDNVDYDIRDKYQVDDTDKEVIIKTSNKKEGTLLSMKNAVQTTKKPVEKGKILFTKTSIKQFTENGDISNDYDLSYKTGVYKDTKKPKTVKGAIKVSKTAKMSSRAVTKLARTSTALSQLSQGEGDKAIKEVAKRRGFTTAKKMTKKITRKVNKVFVKVIKKIGVKIVTAAGATILSAGAIITCVCAIALFMTIFGGAASQATIDKYGDYIVSINREYKGSVDLARSQNPNIVINSYDGSYGRIDWRAVLSVVQGIKGDLVFDENEQRLLALFKEANLYEKQEYNEGEGFVLTITNEQLPAYKDYVNSLFETEPELMKNLVNKTQTALTAEQEEFIDALYTSQDLMMLFSPEIQQYGTFLDENSVDSLSGVVVNGDSEIGNKIARLALTKTGCRYWWGAPGGGFQDGQKLSDPNAAYFDCSGLVAWSHNQAGSMILRLTAKGYSGAGQQISYEQLQAGDIITFATGGNVHHIGIYIGDGKMVHASGDGDTTKGQYADQCVMVSPITKDSYWYKKIYNCRRLY